MNRLSSIWILSELFYPEEQSTGHLMTEIAVGLVGKIDGDVKVITCQPSYAQRGVRAPKREFYRNVEIFRVFSTSFPKDMIFFRLANILTICLSFMWTSIFRFRRGDVVLVVTNPPLLMLVAVVASRLKGARLVLLVHDVYPNILAAIGFLKSDGWVYKAMDLVVAMLYGRMDSIIVIGRDMKEIVTEKVPENEIHVIPNWADSHFCPDESVGLQFRRKLGIEGRFVIQYSGNFGRTHDLLSLVEAAEILEMKGISSVCWMICGWGAQEKSIRSLVREKATKSVIVLPPFRRDELVASLNCCDISVISFIPGMTGLSVPSRMYNAMSVGKPIIALSEPSSELSLVIKEGACGWQIEPRDSQKLAELVQSLINDSPAVIVAGKNAASYVKKHCQFENSLEGYVNVLRNEIQLLN